MDRVTVKDREFEISIPEAQLKERIHALGQRLNAELEGKNPLFLAILNGSFIFAADLLREIDIPCEVSFVKVASYEGMNSTGSVRQLIGINGSIEGRTVILVEDIIDSGHTMVHMLEDLKKYHPAEVRICSLLVKPGNLQVQLDIPYCAFEIPNDFIVGYGLDYDGLGRNLKHIYTVVEP